MLDAAHFATPDDSSSSRGGAPFLEYARGGVGRASHVVVLEQSGLSFLCSAMGNVAGKVC